MSFKIGKLVNWLPAFVAFGIGWTLSYTLPEMILIKTPASWHAQLKSVIFSKVQVIDVAVFAAAFFVVKFIASALNVQNSSKIAMAFVCGGLLRQSISSGA